MWLADVFQVIRILLVSNSSLCCFVVHRVTAKTVRCVSTDSQMVDFSLKTVQGMHWSCDFMKLFYTEVMFILLS